MFKLRATNSCGFTDSEPLTVNMGVAPITGNGSVHVDGANIKIDWRTSSTGAFNSEIEIKDSNGDW